MRILVAGWHGQVAHALSERSTLRDDVTAAAVGRPAMDLSDHSSIGRLLFDIDPHVVINTAAFTHVDNAETNPERARLENTVAAASLAADAARRNIPIIQLSTVHVFDGEQVDPYSENDIPTPINAYGRTKLEGEQAVAAANAAHVIVRTGWVHSPFGKNFVTTLLQRAHQQEAMAFVADQTGSPTYAIHLADALLDIAARITQSPDTDLYGTYHLGGSGGASWHEVAAAAVQSAKTLIRISATVQPISASAYPTHSPRPRHACLDCGKAERTFGVKLPDWKDGIDACVRRILS